MLKSPKTNTLTYGLIKRTSSVLPIPPKLSFREFCDSELSHLCKFYNMAILLNQKEVKIRKIGCESVSQ